MPKPWIRTVAEDAVDGGEAPAQETPRTFTPAPAQGDQKHFDEAVAQARREEKDKLYPEIHRMREELDSLRKEREAEQERLRAEAEAAAAERAEIERKAREEEMSVRELLAAKEQEWQAQLERERVERESALAMLDRERKFAATQSYRAQRIEAERENILPELIDLVAGEDEAQIEASIAGLKERSSRIMSSMVQASDQVRRETAGPRVTAPANGPMDAYTDSRTFTPDQIRGMTNSQYEQHRAALLGRAAESDPGLFG